MIANEAPLLCSEEQIIAKFGDSDFSNKVDTVPVHTVNGIVMCYTPKEVDSRKRTRSSLSPRLTNTPSPASKRLLQLQKEVRDEHDLHRKLTLLSQYQHNGEYEKLDALIEKWTRIVKEAVGALWEEAEQRQTGLTFKQFLAALQLGRDLERIVMESDGDSTESEEIEDDESVMNCLLEADQ